MSEASLTVVTVVNNRAVEVQVEASESLLDMLRERLGLTGAKRACGSGECGACTVLVDGRAQFACVTPAWRVDGTQITTAEGVAEQESGVLLDAFGAEGALQCGFCTPGQYVRAYSLLDYPAGTDIAAELSGNICRCTGYRAIIRAIVRAHGERTLTGSLPGEREERA